MDTIRESDLQQVPEGHWVVLSKDGTRIVAHDKDLQKALASAEQKGETDVEFFKADAVGQFLIGAV